VNKNNTHDDTQSKKQMGRLSFLPDEKRKETEDFCNNLTVPDELERPHQLVRDTIQYKKSRKPSTLPDKDNVLSIHVSEVNYNRSLRIMDTILKAVEKLGFSIVNNNYKTNIRIGCEEINFRITERSKRVPHVLTQEEMADKENGGYFYAPSHDFIPTGFLTLQIDEWCSKRKSWNDTEKQKIEMFVGDFVISLIETGENLRNLREKREEEHRRWLEERERLALLRELREKELEKFKILENEANNYNRARIIKDYIKALYGRSELLYDLGQKENILKYIEWASAKADWLDPMVRSKDPILGFLYSEEADDDFD
jgi:hypothetical protein